MNWQEQFSAMKRWYYRIRDTGTESRSVFTNDGRNKEDYYRAFFTTCYHLKDAFAHDGISGSEEQINNNIYLQLAGDISNLSKHSKLTKTRTGDLSTKGKPVGYVIVAKNGPNYFISEFEIESGGKRYEAKDVVEQCMVAWVDFLILNTLPVPELMEERIYKYFNKWKHPVHGSI